MPPLVKNILAAVLGYVVMAVVIFATFTLAWLILGAGGAFQEGSWEISGVWIAASILLGLLAAVAGGFVCGKVGDSQQAVVMLVVLVAVLGVAAALPEAPTVAGPRPDDVGMMDAMTTAQQPVWVRWLNPLLGAVGALIGGGLGSHRAAASGGDPAADASDGASAA